ncbi:RNA polymerase sigma factor [Peristeroidobacter soli]|uniref:RNA polymerase sigma factor n=1 Tax=Peristeroidobacter soli TaxID=2497877 RepID=UPI00101DD187|nr:sigma-70 family RNA polymerase sigma factor [Peristeroidobacter soli]
MSERDWSDVSVLGELGALRPANLLAAERRAAEVPFEQIVRDHGPLLRRIATSYEADPERRNELHQDILLAIWRALPSFRNDSLLRTFLARIAHNRGVSHVAREASRPRTTELTELEPSPQPSPLEHADITHRQALLMEQVRQLPLGMRELVVLTLEGFTPREIANVLNLSPNVISIRLTRAKAMLRSAFTSQD